jgi:hypothetical protein
VVRRAKKENRVTVSSTVIMKRNRVIEGIITVRYRPNVPMEGQWLKWCPIRNETAYTA